MANTKIHRQVISFVSDTVWPYFKGGKEKRLFDITTRLAKRGFDVHVYTMKWWSGANIIIENGVTLHALCRLYPLYSNNRRSIKEGVLFGLSCLRLITEKWDVIDVDHMPYFPLYSVKLICFLKRKKMFATWHEVWGKDYWIKYMGILGYVSYIIENISVLLPNKIISISEHTTNKLKNLLSCKKHISTIPVGIDFDYVQSIKSSKTKSDVIYVGRLLSHKNIDILIKSIKILKKYRPKIKSLIIGNGPEKKILEELVKNYKLQKNIKFLGFVNNHDNVYSLIKSSKIFVLPSTREGFGIVVIEANACGLPVITTNYPDNAAKDLIIEGKNGYVCQLGENEIAQSIKNILNQSLYEQTKEICQNIANRYDWGKIINNIEEVYSK